MIVVRVELWSARTGEKTELARMHICNDGTSAGSYRNYIAYAFRGRNKEQLDKNTIQHQGSILNWPSERLHIWNLVRKALVQLGYVNE